MMKKTKIFFNDTREQLKKIESDIYNRTRARIEDAHPEVIANLIIARRHIEDARMRLGKAIQYCDGNGVSCYDNMR
jgi:hypothetical protein